MLFLMGALSCHAAEEVIKARMKAVITAQRPHSWLVSVRRSQGHQESELLIVTNNNLPY
jgi:hypothetical protein